MTLRNQKREIAGQKKIKLIYLTYRRLIDKELKKFRDSDAILIALLFSKLSKIIEDMYGEIRTYVESDFKELVRDNFYFPYLLVGTITIAASPDVSKLFINKNINRTINNQLINLETSLKKQIYSRLFDFVESGYQTSQIDDIIYYRKGKMLSGDVARLIKLYRTESTRLRTESKLDAIDNLRQLGFTVRRQWLYTWESIKPREEHVLSNGLSENAQGYFSINGYLTKGPGLFGVPSEDINCRCDTEVYVDEQQ